EQLAIAAHHVVAFEIDGRLIPLLDKTLAHYENITIVHEDFLEADVGRVMDLHFKAGQPLHLVANLPYYITTPILMKVVQSYPEISYITVMLQKEVAERMAAKPNTKAYGSLSIAVQYYTEASVLMDVPQTVFIPQPKVTSSVLHLERRAEPLVHVIDESLFFSIVQASFAHRRKTLRNNLLRHFKERYAKEEVDGLLNRAEIDGGRRGE